MAATATLATKPLMPGFGVEIAGVDVTEADRPTLNAITDLLHKHGAIVLRGQSLSQAQQIAFTKLFGTPAENSRPEFCDPDYPDIYVISNKKKDGKPIGDPAAGLRWHTDFNYHRNPALCTMLYALEVPKQGSDTQIADTCAAWGALPPERQRELEGLKVCHSYQKLTTDRGQTYTEAHRREFPDVIHPLVRRHPYDGRLALWVSARPVIREVVGMEQEQGLALIDEMVAFATQDRFVYSHKWQPGDILVWDNRCTLHRGTMFDMENDVRHVHRTWVRGERPQ